DGSIRGKPQSACDLRPDHPFASLRRSFSIPPTRRAASAISVASGPAASTAREVVGTTAPRAPANTRARSAVVPPCAPRPGASRGPFTAARSTPSSAAAAPMVAPTTSPALPSEPPARSARFSSATSRATWAATGWPAPVRACCTRAPSGLAVRHSTNTPRPWATAVPVAAPGAGTLHQGPFGGGGRPPHEPSRAVGYGGAGGLGQGAHPQIRREGHGVGRQRGTFGQVGLGVGGHGRSDIATFGVEDAQD